MFKKKPCPTCAEKDHRLADLKEQVAFLRRQLSPPGNPLTLYEADAILSGQQEVLEIPTPDMVLQARAEISERDRILTGNF